MLIVRLGMTLSGPLQALVNVRVVVEVAVSWDLQIALHERPELDAQAFEVDGPTAIDAADLPAALAAAVLAPRWLVSVSLPETATATARQAASKWARGLGERYRGAVYDPQEDRVVWPKSARRPKVVPAERIRVVEMRWWVAPSRAPDAAAALVDAARTRLPEALPRRFGDHEPFQGRCEDGDFAPFQRDWQAASAGLFRSLFWTATSPCFGGSAMFPDERLLRRFDRGQRQVLAITAHFDGRVLDGDPEWREAGVDFFRDAGANIGAFFGAAVVARNIIVRSGRLGYDGQSETLGLPGSTWAGLPSLPLWLAFFGAPYSDLVNSSFVRAGEGPSDIDQAARTFPPLPAALVSPDWRAQVAQLPELK